MFMRHQASSQFLADTGHNRRSEGDSTAGRLRSQQNFVALISTWSSRKYVNLHVLRQCHQLRFVLYKKVPHFLFRIFISSIPTLLGASRNNMHKIYKLFYIQSILMMSI
jgi:hypothetical protein